MKGIRHKVSLGSYVISAFGTNFVRNANGKCFFLAVKINYIFSNKEWW